MQHAFGGLRQFTDRLDISLRTIITIMAKVQILSFWHTNFSIMAPWGVFPPPPPQEVGLPRGNTGSTTAYLYGIRLQLTIPIDSWTLETPRPVNIRWEKERHLPYLCLKQIDYDLWATSLIYKQIYYKIVTRSVGSHSHPSGGGCLLPTQFPATLPNLHPNWWKLS